MRAQIIAVAAAMLLIADASASGAEPLTPVEAVRDNAVGASATPQEVRTAVTRSLQLIESSGAEYRRQRQCFSCHHQAMPILTLVDAQRRGFEIDEENLQAQLEHTAAHLERGRGAYAEGRGQGGQADTAGWALWALAAAEHSPDEATEAVAHYLIDKDRDLGRWSAAGRGRRPTQGSDYTTTYLAIYGLRTFATPEQEARSSDRISSAQKWIVDSKPNDTEDLVFRLRALYELSVDDKMLETAASDLLRMQRDDGGWAQTPASLSDAYATGTVLTALVETGQLPIDSTTYTRGVAYLLKTQRSDGSWRVETRAEPIQTYFESGFPHGKDQFISMAATCWATMTLLKSCPEVPTGQ